MQVSIKEMTKAVFKEIMKTIYAQEQDIDIKNMLDDIVKYVDDGFKTVEILGITHKLVVIITD